jgi:hypothetical protein
MVISTIECNRTQVVPEHVGQPSAGAVGEQLTLLDVPCERVVGNREEALSLSEQIALLEQEVGYYRRVIAPILTRVSARFGAEYPARLKEISQIAPGSLPASYGTIDRAAGPDRQETSRRSAGREQAASDRSLVHHNGHPGEESAYSRLSSAIAQWFAEGQQLFSGLSQTLEGQKRLEVRLQVLERDSQQVREEIADLFDGEAEPPSIFDTGWFRSALVLLILAIVVTVTVPYLLALWEASPPSSPAAHSRVTEPGRQLDTERESLGTFFSPRPTAVDEPVRPDARVPAKGRR